MQRQSPYQPYIEKVRALKEGQRIQFSTEKENLAVNLRMAIYRNLDKDEKATISVSLYRVDKNFIVAIKKVVPNEIAFSYETVEA